MKYGYEQQKNAEIIDSSVVSSRYYAKSHKHICPEIICAVSGKVTGSVSGKPFELSKGEIIVVPGGIAHTIDVTHLPERFISVIPDVKPEGTVAEPRLTFERLVSHEWKNSEEGVIICSALNPTQTFDRIFSTIVSERGNEQWGTELLVEAMINVVLVRIVRNRVTARGFNLRSVQEDAVSVLNVGDYIESHYDDSVKVAELAELCGLSYTHFARRFKELYGISCKEYIEKTRIKKAKELLLTTNYDLSFISQELGFSDCSHLIRVFKKLEGITPKQYRVGNRK